MSVLPVTHLTGVFLYGRVGVHAVAVLPDQTALALDHQTLLAVQVTHAPDRVLLAVCGHTFSGYTIEKKAENATTLFGPVCSLV